MTFRWLIDDPADGVTNMARDEAILTMVGQGEAPVTLRFYRWAPPTISLGYFQNYDDFAALPPPAGELAVVRRQTGGGAILHDLELTYSFAVPLGHPLLSHGGPNGLYNRVHDAVATLLQRCGIAVERGPQGSGTCSHGGPFFCFEQHCCFDLLVAGLKLMGSAQRRTRTAILQHGSLILDSRFDQQHCSRAIAESRIDIHEHLPPLVAAIAGEPVGDPTGLTPAELELAHTLCQKYADPAWTRKR